MDGRTRLRADGRLRRVAGPLALAVGTSGLGAVLVTLGPSTVVPFRCPFLALTGLDCPFCGGTRGAAALARGDLIAAADLNALTTMLLLGLAAGGLVLLVARLRGRTITWVPGNRAWSVLLVTTLTFWVLRNLPGPTAVLGA